MLPSQQDQDIRPTTRKQLNIHICGAGLAGLTVAYV